MTFELCPECGLETPYDDDGDEVVENLCPDCAAALTTLDSGEDK